MALLLSLACLLMWRVSLLTVNGEEHRYDYVIVGAGTAGMTIAARISEDPKVQVAVLEAGNDYDRLPVNKRLVDTPGFDSMGCGGNPSDNANDAIDWKLYTTPQGGANNRTVRYAQGKTIGGGSARNFMIYQRATRGSLDKWAELTGDPEWTFENRFSDYQRACRLLLLSTICARSCRQLGMIVELSLKPMGQCKSRIPTRSNLFPSTCNLA